MSDADPKTTESGAGKVHPGPEPPEAMMMAGMAGRTGHTAPVHRTLAAGTGSFSVRSTPAGQVITTPTRVVLELSPELAADLDEIKGRTGDSPSDVFRKALGLYKLAEDAKREGKSVGIAETPEALETEFVGL